MLRRAPSRNPGLSTPCTEGRLLPLEQIRAALAALATKPDCKIDVFCHPLRVDGQDAGLSSLLSRPDIAAVVVALPILQQPAVTRTAIAAGKHVLSEKPVAGTVAAARDLLAWYDALPTDTRSFWGVAENYRFKRSLQFAAAKIAGLLREHARVIFRKIDLGAMDLTGSARVTGCTRLARLTYGMATKQQPYHPTSTISQPTMAARAGHNDNSGQIAS
ncbi:hypothetical protein HK405_012323, partial [Cladochytrium tenue]